MERCRRVDWKRDERCRWMKSNEVKIQLRDMGAGDDRER